jgi:Beta-glucan synthesis-associated protein SKN1/KRE6/Sbg1
VYNDAPRGSVDYCSLPYLVWTMGNLGRAGYGASTDGTWPYSVMFSSPLDWVVHLILFHSMIHVIGEHSPIRRFRACLRQLYPVAIPPSVVRFLFYQAGCTVHQSPGFALTSGAFRSTFKCLHMSWRTSPRSHRRRRIICWEICTGNRCPRSYRYRWRRKSVPECPVCGTTLILG